MIFFGMFAFYILDGSKYLSLEDLAKNYKSISSFVHDSYGLSVVLLIFIYIVSVFFSIPIKPLLKIVAGLFFGLCYGVALSLFSATVGATLIFLFLKYLWGVDENGSKYRLISRFKSIFETSPFLFLTLSRLLPIPFFVPNILAAILNVRNVVFIASTFIGIIPMTVLYVWLGSSFAVYIQSTDKVDINSLLSSQSSLIVILISLLTSFALLLKFFLVRQKVLLEKNKAYN